MARGRHTYFGAFGLGALTPFLTGLAGPAPASAQGQDPVIALPTNPGGEDDGSAGLAPPGAPTEEDAPDPSTPNATPQPPPPVDPPPVDPPPVDPPPAEAPAPPAAAAPAPAPPVAQPPPVAPAPPPERPAARVRESPPPVHPPAAPVRPRPTM